MPIGSINDLIAKLNETKKPKEKDESATWRKVPNRDARRHDGRPLPRTGQAARYRRVVAARPRHQASVSAALRATRKVEARKAVAAERRLLTAIIDAEHAVQLAELTVEMYELSQVFVGSDGSRWHLMGAPVDMAPLSETRKATA